MPTGWKCAEVIGKFTLKRGVKRTNTNHIILPGRHGGDGVGSCGGRADHTRKNGGEEKEKRPGSIHKKDRKVEISYLKKKGNSRSL